MSLGHATVTQDKPPADRAAMADGPAGPDEIDIETAARLAGRAVVTLRRWCQRWPGLARPWLPPGVRGRASWIINRERLAELMAIEGPNRGRMALPAGALRQPPVPRPEVEIDGWPVSEAALALGRPAGVLLLWSALIPSMLIKTRSGSRIDPLLLIAADWSWRHGPPDLTKPAGRRQFRDEVMRNAADFVAELRALTTAGDARPATPEIPVDPAELQAIAASRFARRLGLDGPPPPTAGPPKRRNGAGGNGHGN